MDKASLFIVSVFLTIMLAGLVFIASMALESRRIAQHIEEQHQTFLANQATILRDNDRMLHQHDAQGQEHRAILQRLAH